MIPGTGPIRITALDRGILLEKPTCQTAPAFWKWREFSWAAQDEPAPAPGVDQGGEWRMLALLAASCGLLLAGGLVLSLLDAPHWMVAGSLALAMMAGGYDAAIDAFGKLRRGAIDIHFLMLAVAIGATAIGAYHEGALLLFLFSLSGALEAFALHRTHREIRSLVDASPKTARVVDAGGATRTIPVEEVGIGNHVRVNPDESFPLDGKVVEGRTAADESNLTGEAVPVPKESGDFVFGGTLNLWGVATVEVTRPSGDSSIQRIIRLIYEAEQRKAPSERFTDRFGTRYTWLVLVLTALVFLGWWLGGGLPPFLGDAENPSAFYRAMTFLVVASPCALVLSIPSAILAAIARGARGGILFRGGAAIEKLAEIDTVALDKTGTLTTGELHVASVESFPPGREDDILELAYSIERHSNHPIARAITAHGQRLGLAASSVDDLRSVSGRGIQARAGKETCYLGRRDLIQKGSLGEVLAATGEPPPEVTEVWVIRKDLIGRLLLRDNVRFESAAVLRELRRLGIRTLMLTGDRRSAAEAVGRDLGIDEIKAGLLPEDKVAAIRELEQAGARVAMVGDGVNDAPSLAAAHVSVAMGARGSDAALEQAEIILMKDRIEKFVDALDLARRTRKLIRANLAISLGTISVMMLASIAGLVPLTVGVIAHEGSTVVVCLNSLRLLFTRFRPEAPGFSVEDAGAES